MLFATNLTRRAQRGPPFVPVVVPKLLGRDSWRVTTPHVQSFVLIYMLLGQPTTPPSGDDLAVLNYHLKRPAATLAFPLLCNSIVLPIPPSTGPYLVLFMEAWFSASMPGQTLHNTRSPRGNSGVTLFLDSSVLVLACGVQWGK